MSSLSPAGIRGYEKSWFLFLTILQSNHSIFATMRYYGNQCARSNEQQYHDALEAQPLLIATSCAERSLGRPVLFLGEIELFGSSASGLKPVSSRLFSGCPSGNGDAL